MVVFSSLHWMVYGIDLAVFVHIAPDEKGSQYVLLDADVICINLCSFRQSAKPPLFIAIFRNIVEI